MSSKKTPKKFYVLCLIPGDDSALTVWKEAENPLKIEFKALKTYADFVKPFAEKGESVNDMLSDFLEFTQSYLITNGLSAEDAAKYEAANPAYMSAAGLMRYWKKQNEAKS